jgi:hypothetical protein
MFEGTLVGATEPSPAKRVTGILLTNPCAHLRRPSLVFARRWVYPLDFLRSNTFCAKRFPEFRQRVLHIPMNEVTHVKSA